MVTAPPIDLQRPVLSNRRIGPHAFVLRFERGALDFEPGHFISVGVSGDLNQREYSIYSGPNEPWLEILVREVDQGLVSRRLARLTAGDKVRVEGPFGYFTFDGGPLFLIASGTGIAPYHSLAKQGKRQDYTVLHGIRHDGERYDCHDYTDGSYTACVSQPDSGSQGLRVTEWLRQNPDQPRADATCYLSGNCDMIYEVYDLLRQRGFSADRIKAEVYF